MKKAKSRTRARTTLQPSIGRIYDVDFIESGDTAQIVLNAGPGMNGLFITKDQLMELVACAGLIPTTTATITGTGSAPQTAVAIYLTTNAPGVVRGTVKELTFMNGSAEVIIDGEPSALTTDDPRMIAILTSAMQLQKPVQQVSYDPTTFRLIRAKINVP